jgi:rod shape-determining protein MreD
VKKFLVFFLLGLLLLIAQAIWRMLFPGWRTSPEFLFILVVYSGVNRNPFIGPILAFCFGFMTDSLWGVQPGLTAATYTIVYFLSRLSGRRFYIRSYVYQVLIVALMTFLAKALVWFILSTLDSTADLGAVFWTTVWRQMLWNGLFAIPVVSQLERMEQRVSEDYAERFMGSFGEW